MDVVRVEDPERFAERTRSLLMADEARHNLLFGIVGSLIDEPDTYPEFHLWIVEEGGDPVGAALRTPPHNLAISAASPEALLALVGGLQREDADLPGVTGAVPEVETFRDAWRRAVGAKSRRRTAMGIYRLSEVRTVRRPPGRMRPATDADRDRVGPWLEAFMDEALSAEAPRTPPDRLLDRLLGGTSGRLFVWEDEEIVSLAGRPGRTPNGVRIGPVYTPPEHRRVGYASALVADLSALTLEEGSRFCFLYTDLANRTSNRIYRDIGYEHVCDAMDYAFARTGPSTA